MNNELARIETSPEDHEYGALAKLPNEELRGRSDQIRHILRAEPQQRALLTTETAKPSTKRGPTE